MKCPHCLTACFVGWVFNDLGDDAFRAYRAKHTVCPSCHTKIILLEQLTPQTTIVIETAIVHPRGVSRPLPPEVPNPYRDDFSESCLVLTYSAKASAALSRRTLQALLRDQANAQKKDLFDQIEEVLNSGKLPSHLCESLHALRNIGNFAAHPMKSTNTGEIVDVEPGEAEWALDVLEGLFDFYFVRPAQTAARKAALNAKLKEAGKPELT